MPISDYLVARMPFGRDFHTLKAFDPPKLDTETLAKMRAPMDEQELETLKSQIEADSDDENGGANAVAGAFSPSRTESSAAYY